ncbi:MAG: hypothetical protein H0X70_03885 [Segetibacter sp.]|nr:hypothetical protein [Segetibacter sp.]
MIKSLSAYFDVSYFLKFILLFLMLHYFHLFFVGITNPGGQLYSSFLDHFLNYVSWIKISVLYTSNVLAHALGINSYLRLDTYILKIANGPGLFMAFPCAGLDIMSFWIAFVNADNKNTWQKKVYWCVVGVSIIWLINCFRVTLLLFALQNRWELVTGVDQHTTFNIVAYSFICLLVYFYNKSYEKKIFVVNL